MPRVYKMSINGLRNLIAEESDKLMNEMKKGKKKSKSKGAKGFGGVADVSQRAKETRETDADELGTDAVHVKDIDQLHAQKIKEAKLLLQLKRLREAMRSTAAKIQESRE